MSKSPVSEKRKAKMREYYHANKAIKKRVFTPEEKAVNVIAKKGYTTNEARKILGLRIRRRRTKTKYRVVDKSKTP